MLAETLEPGWINLCRDATEAFTGLDEFRSHDPFGLRRKQTRARPQKELVATSSGVLLVVASMRCAAEQPR